MVKLCRTEGVCVCVCLHTVSMNSLSGRARYAGVCMLSRGRKRGVIFSVFGCGCTPRPSRYPIGMSKFPDAPWNKRVAEEEADSAYQTRDPTL